MEQLLTNPTIPAMLAIQSPQTRPQVSMPLVSIGLLIVAAMVGLSLARRAKPRKHSGGLTKTESHGNPSEGTEAGANGSSKNSFSPVPRTVISWVPPVLLVGCALWLWPNVRIQFANPLVSQQRISDEQAAEVTRSLMHNLYRSFDRRDESVIYDQLATCVSGDLLREIYIQIMKRIKLEDQGGAQVKVDRVDVLETGFVFRDDSPGSKSNVKWNVLGSIGHWGHLHTRANQYVAEFGAEPVNGAWKIVSMQITDEANLGSQRIR